MRLLFILSFQCHVRYGMFIIIIDALTENFLSSHINQPHLNSLCAVMKHLFMKRIKSSNTKGEKRSDLHIMTHRVAKWKHSFQYEYLFIAHQAAEREKKVSRY